MRSAVIAASLTAAALLSTMAPVHAEPAQREERVAQVRLLGERTVPHKLSYADTTVGGLSGIDRNPCTGEYVLISDDRSVINPARFYTARIDVDASGVRSIDLTGTHPFRQADGTTYPPTTANDGKAVDPEELRVDPWTCDHWWAQEGDRQPDQVIQPSVIKSTPLGAHQGELPLPSNYAITQDQGPRRNQALEAVTFGARGALVTTAVEGPLVQDGPVPTTSHGALSRVTTQTRRGKIVGQYAYPLEPIFAEVKPGSPWAPDTGIPAILALPSDPTRFLVLERTYVDGSGYKIRLFEATTRDATDVRDIESLANQPVKAMSKRLLADFADLGLSTVDNTEGMTWGPRLPSGERTLILVSDDNFYAGAVTQVVALALR